MDIISDYEKRDSLQKSVLARSKPLTKVMAKTKQKNRREPSVHFGKIQTQNSTTITLNRTPKINPNTQSWPRTRGLNSPSGVIRDTGGPGRNESYGLTMTSEMRIQSVTGLTVRRRNDEVLWSCDLGRPETSCPSLLLIRDRLDRIDFGILR